MTLCSSCTYYFSLGFLIYLKSNNNLKYGARRLMGSRIIESAAYCNQNLLAHLYLSSTQNTSVNWIIQLLLSLFCWTKVILLSGGHCTTFLLMLFLKMTTLKSKKIEKVWKPCKPLITATKWEHLTAFFNNDVNIFH